METLNDKRGDTVTPDNSVLEARMRELEARVKHLEWRADHNFYDPESDTSQFFFVVIVALAVFGSVVAIVLLA